MRHRKKVFKIGRTDSHKNSLLSNMLKSLIDKERLVTSAAKAKELKRHADRMVTLAKQNTLASRRRAIARLQLRYNTLSTKERRQQKEGDTSGCNTDRLVLNKLFDVLGKRFAAREGGYTRVIRLGTRVGDAGQTCVIEYLSE